MTVRGHCPADQRVRTPAPISMLAPHPEEIERSSGRWIECVRQRACPCTASVAKCGTGLVFHEASASKSVGEAPKRTLHAMGRTVSSNVGHPLNAQ